MREYSFRKDGFTFERVSKATARRVFNNDMPITQFIFCLFAFLLEEKPSNLMWVLLNRIFTLS